MKKLSRPIISKRLIETQPLPCMRLMSIKTNLEDALIMHGSVPGGDHYAPKENPALPGLVVAMLDEGTHKHTKQEIREQLESIGAHIEFGTSHDRVQFSAYCMKKDAETVIAILAEQLQYPLFPAHDFEIVKQRLMSELDEQMEDTKFRAETRFLQCLYPKGHPNYRHDTAFLKKCIKNTPQKALAEFHQKTYGRDSMIVAAAGDVDSDALTSLFKSAFASWNPLERLPPVHGERALETTQETHVITVHDKTSVDLYVGAPIGINKTHQDFYPLSLGISILGGTFFARLMNNVREKKGLTYRIRSGIGGADMQRDGYWYAFAMFAPELLSKGEDALMLEIREIVKSGVTAQELRIHKETIDGSYKVSFSSADSTSLLLVSNAEEGRPHTFLDTYVNMINAIKLDEVNAAIKKYIRLDNLVTVIAGSIDTEKKPLYKL